MELKYKNDKYRKARGGYSRFLDIRCSECDHHVAFYQKDGPGALKRMYFDRIIERIDAPGLTCLGCGAKIGSKYIYEKENREAYLLNHGSFSKKIVKKV